MDEATYTFKSQKSLSLKAEYSFAVHVQYIKKCAYFNDLVFDLAHVHMQAIGPAHATVEVFGPNSYDSCPLSHPFMWNSCCSGCSSTCSRPLVHLSCYVAGPFPAFQCCTLLGGCFEKTGEPRSQALFPSFSMLHTALYDYEDQGASSPGPIPSFFSVHTALLL